MPIIIDDILAAQRKCTYILCRGVFGYQTDVQCLGFDHICALAMLEDGNSFTRIAAARQKINTDPYYAGFQKGWDGVSTDSPDEKQGHSDGMIAASKFKWSKNKTNHSDVYER